MKKKILFIGLFLVAAVVSFQLDSKSENLDRLMLENIEALASGEWGNNYFCAGVGCVDCPITSRKVQYIGHEYSLENLN